MVSVMNITCFKTRTIFDFLLSQNHSAIQLNRIILFLFSLLQHHQRRLARKPPHPVPVEMLPAPVEMSSKEKPRLQRQHLAQTEPELDQEECGDSTLTTALESKCELCNQLVATSDLFLFIFSGPVPVLVMSLLFIASVFMLHIWGKFTKAWKLLHSKLDLFHKEHLASTVHLSSLSSYSWVQLQSQTSQQTRFVLQS